MNFMVILLKNNMKKVEETLLKNRKIFVFFDEVYLFGSSICNHKESNDIDLLLVYKTYSDEVIYNKNTIISYLNRIFKNPIDITILSKNELWETQFLKKLNKGYRKII